MITLFCVPASSDQAVRCEAIIKCTSRRPETVQLRKPQNYSTFQPCNISIIVWSQFDRKKLDQLNFTNVVPMVQPTTTIAPNGEYCACSRTL